MRRTFLFFTLVLLLPVSSGSARAFDQNQIDTAVEKAVSWLKTQQQPDGSWRGRATDTWAYPAGPTAIALWALLIPDTLNLVYREWMRFGLLLSKVTTPIIMGAVFFLIITPTAIFLPGIVPLPLGLVALR